MRMRAQSACRTVLVGVGLAVAGALSMGAAGQSPASIVDPLPALLAEVHALRVTMEQSASIGPRVQLTLARLNIQEQRVSHLSAQLDAIRQQLNSDSVSVSRFAEAIADLEGRIALEADPVKRTVMQEQQRDFKREIPSRTKMEQQLRDRESEAAQALANEQGRWNDLNARLDELERLLAPVR